MLPIISKSLQLFSSARLGAFQLSPLKDFKCHSVLDTESIVVEKTNRFRLGGRNDNKRNELINFQKTAFTLAEGATHVAMPPVFSKAGFTLAEVLITLGIIGVVAAMTIPTLLTHLDNKAAATKLKKAYSVLSQATRFMTANDETIVAVCATNDSYCLGEYFNKYMKFITVRKGKPQGDNLKDCWFGNIMDMPSEIKYCGVTSDGISYLFDMEYSSGQENDSDRVALISVDINNVNKPNIYGKDRYTMQVTAGGQITTRIRIGNIEDYPCDFGKTQGQNGYYKNLGCSHLILKNMSK